MTKGDDVNDEERDDDAVRSIFLFENLSDERMDERGEWLR